MNSYNTYSFLISSSTGACIGAGPFNESMADESCLPLAFNPAGDAFPPLAGGFLAAPPPF